MTERNYTDVVQLRNRLDLVNKLMADISNEKYSMKIVMVTSGDIAIASITPENQEVVAAIREALFFAWKTEKDDLTQKIENEHIQKNPSSENT